MPNHPLQHITLAIVGFLALASVVGCTGSNTDINPYSDDHLNAWIEIVRDAVDDVPAYAGSGIGFRNLDDKRIRIQLRAYPNRGARKAMEDAISTVDVPRDAIVLEVGCEYPEPSSVYPRISLDEPFLQSVNYSLEVPSQATYGDTVPLKLTFQNVGDETVMLRIGGSEPEGVMITASDDKGVWYWDCGRFDYDSIKALYLEPGEKREFAEEWEQVDHRGVPVPPGDYLVYGTMVIGPSEQPGGHGLYRLTTKPRHLQILRRWDR